MGLNDEDEDLKALRLAALSTMKAKRDQENAMKANLSSVRHRPSSGGVSIRDGFGNQNNAVFQPHYNSNLIAIVPISPGTMVDQSRRRGAKFRRQQQNQDLNRPKLILPQHRYCKTEETIVKKREDPAVKTKFNRYDSSSSDSSEDSEDDGSTASGEKPAIVPDKPADEDKVLSADITSDNCDTDTEQSFAAEFEVCVKPEKDDKDIIVTEPVVFSDSKLSPETLVVANLPPSPPPKEDVILPIRSPPKALLRSPPHYPLARSRSRSKSPCYASRPFVERSRSRSRSRSRGRLGRSRSRSPRRYGPRRSVSPKRRAISPRYVSPRRLSPHGHPSPPRRRSSPTDRLSPVRRRLSPPPRRYASPLDRLPSPRRRVGDRLSPWRRVSPSPPRRHYSPPGRLPSPRRRAMSPDRMSPTRRRKSLSPNRMSPTRRRKSPSPIKRNPSPPRRFSPLRRSPLGRRVSPPRRNPSPPRKAYPLGSQQSRQYSPRRYPSPPARGLSPRRYNSQPLRRISPARLLPGSHSQPVGGMSPWSPPRNNRRSISPPFVRKRSISPRVRNRRGSISPPYVKNDRKSISPRPIKRRDSISPHFEQRKGHSSSPLFFAKRGLVSPRLKRSSGSPRPDYKRKKGRGSTSPNFVSRRKSISPRPDNRKTAPASPRFVAKRRSSFSPKGPRLGTRKRSNSPGSFDRRPVNSPLNSRRLDERDARVALRGSRDAADTRDRSKSLSLSPPPDRVKEKSPLRVRPRRSERSSGKKHSKSKKSRDKTAEKTPGPTAEKTEKTDQKSSVLEARRKKFESVDLIKPVNKKIRLKTAADEQLPDDTPPKADEGEESTPVATGMTTDMADDEDEDALVLDSPADLWSEEESDSDNEGRFKSTAKVETDHTKRVGVLSFKNLLQPVAPKQPEPKRFRDRIGTRVRRNSPARDKKRRRERGGKGPGSVLSRIGERGSWKARQAAALVADVGDAGVGQQNMGASPERLPALMSKEILKPDLMSQSNEVEEESAGRVARLDSTDQHGDLRAALSRKRAAKSNVLFPFKGGDLGPVPGSRLVQSAFLDVVGKKHKRTKKTLTQALHLNLLNDLGGIAKDARRVTLCNNVRASVKLLSDSVTLATDESALTSKTTFIEEETIRKLPVRLRLGLTHHTEEFPGGRKVKLKRNNASSDQV